MHSFAFSKPKGIYQTSRFLATSKQTNSWKNWPTLPTPNHRAMNFFTNIILTNPQTRTKYYSMLWVLGESNPLSMIYFGRRGSLYLPPNCWGVPFASGMISFSANPPDTGALLPGIRIIPTGQEHSQCSISPAGSHSMMLTRKMGAFITFPKAMSGIYYPSLGLQATWNLLNLF